MDGNPEQPCATVGVDVPRHLAESLDQSAEDVRHGRVEDARAALARLKRSLDHPPRQGHIAVGARDRRVNSMTPSLTLPSRSVAMSRA